jgi:hypothetical protein
MNDPNTPRRAPAAGIEAMAGGEGDLATGRVFELVAVIAESVREDEVWLANPQLEPR